MATSKATPTQIQTRLHTVAIAAEMTANARGDQEPGGMASLALIAAGLVRMMEKGDRAAIEKVADTVRSWGRRRGRPVKHGAQVERLSAEMEKAYLAMKETAPRNASWDLAATAAFPLAQHFLALLFLEPSSPITRELRARKAIGLRFPGLSEWPDANKSEISDRAAIVKVAEAFQQVINPTDDTERPTGERFVSAGLRVLGHRTKDLHARAKRRFLLG